MTGWKLFVVIFILTICSVQGFYKKDGPVTILNASNFNELVLNSNKVWMVEFYAPWCGHCKALKNDWKKAAAALGGMVRLGAVDATVEQTLASKYHIQGYPTIKIFNPAKSEVEDYRGARDASSITSAAISAAKDLARARLSGKDTNSAKPEDTKNPKDTKEKKHKSVIELTDSNFDDLVMNSEDVWMLKFFAPWCGHCKAMKKDWIKAAQNMEGKVKFGEIDATVHTKLAQRFGIRGYPTIKAFKGGKKQMANVIDYEQGRSAEAFTAFARDLMKQSEEESLPLEIVEITHQETFDQVCNESTCLLLFVPDIRDAGKVKRNELLELFKRLGEKQMRSMFRYGWLAGGSQPELEDRLGLGFGYPALVTIAKSKNRYAVYRGAFEEEKLLSFIRSIQFGTVRTSPLPTIPSLMKVNAWDGEDAPVIEEEEYEFDDEVSSV